MRNVLLLVALLTSACATAGPRKGLQPEQVVQIERVRLAAISPDGRHVAYTLQSPRDAGEKPGGPHTSLWVLKDGAKAAARFSREGTEVGSPSWSPDSTRLLFTSARGKDAKSQVWSIPVDGGEATAVTSAPDGVMSYALAPDGKRIAWVTLAPKDKEREKAAKEGRDAIVADEHHRHHRVRVGSVGGGDSKDVSPPGRSAFEVAWSPDGSRLALMTAASPKNDDNLMFRSLVVVAAGGGPATVLAKGMGKMGHPAWSPDSKHIAFRGAATPNDGTTGTLWVVQSDGSAAPRALNVGALETAYHFEWIAADALLVSAVAGTSSNLTRRTLDGKVTSAMKAGPVFLGFSVDAAGRRIALAGDSAKHPPELFTGEVGGKLARRTKHNAWLKDVKLAKQSTVTWNAQDGLEIQGVFIEAIDAKGPTPLLLYPHGGPEWQDLDGWKTRYLTAGQVMAARGYSVLYPNYRGSAGRGAKFAKADHRDLGGKEFQDIIDGVNHLAARGTIDPKRVGMMGGSYGGYMSALAATKGSEHFAAAIDFAGIGSWMSFMGTSDIPHEMSLVHWDLYCTESAETAKKCEQASPLGHLWNARTPLMVVHGEQDKRVPIGQAHELYTAFRLREIPTQLVIYPREGHGLRERAHKLDLMERTIQWFDKYLKP